MMTSFGWKRKLGNCSKATAAVFSESNVLEDDKDVTSVDWLLNAKKRRINPDEDKETKFQRLKNEGSVLAENQRFWEAMKIWDQAILIKPKDATLHEMKSQALMQVGECFPAIQAAEKAVVLNPTWWVAYQTLGRAQLGIGEVQMAVRSFSHAVHLNPEDRELRNEDLKWAVSLLKEKQSINESSTGEILKPDKKEKIE